MYIALSIIYFLLSANTTYFKADHGKVTFESDASMEKIIAHSREVKGLIDTKNNTFAFSVDLSSFQGFNSELQKDHYEENYVESDKFPKALFNGKIIEEVDYSHKGLYDVRAKGDFELHGIKINKIIHSTIKVLRPGELSIHSTFLLNLKDYSIKIPRLVHKKIAEDIKVTVDIHMNQYTAIEK